MCSLASAIFASVVTILVTFEAILKRFSVKNNTVKVIVYLKL